MNVISATEAIRQAQQRINDKCREAGIPALSGHDIPVLAADRIFQKAYAHTLARLQPGQEEQFNADCVTYAAKLIAQAILS